MATCVVNPLCTQTVRFVFWIWQPTYFDFRRCPLDPRYNNNRSWKRKPMHLCLFDTQIVSALVDHGLRRTFPVIIRLWSVLHVSIIIHWSRQHEHQRGRCPLTDNHQRTVFGRWFNIRWTSVSIDVGDVNRARYS